MAWEMEKENRMIGSLSDEFTISDGNQRMQDLFLNRRAYPITELIHEEDRPALLEKLKEHAKAGVEAVVRVLGLDNRYRWHYVYMYQFQTENGRTFYHVEMQDICQMGSYVRALEKENGQMERLLGIQQNMFFIYSYETDRIKIFWMRNHSIYTVAEKSLEEWERDGRNSEQFCVEDELTFHLMCRDIRNGAERFVHDVMTSEFSRTGKAGVYRFRGGAWRYKGELKECYGTIQLVDKKTQRIKFDSTLEEQLDPLTGVYNKRVCTDKLRSLIDNKDGEACYLCMIDLDNLKSLNDTYGHLFGDRVLMVVADTMREVLGNRGIVGRFGGDEFFMIIDSAIDEQELRQIIFTIRKNIRWYFENSEDQLVVTLSAGVAAYPKDAQSVDKLMAMADRALYIAKEKGKDRYIIYDEEKHGKVTFDEEHRKIVEMSIKKTETSRLSVVLYIYELLEQKGAEALEEVMGLIGKAFEVDRINIFLGNDLHLWKAWGRETWTVENAGYILYDNYLELFNSHRIYCCADIEALAYKYPQVYRYLYRYNVRSDVQYLLGNGSDKMGLISYDLLKGKKKWSEEEESSMTIISRLIESAIWKAAEAQTE